MKKYLLYSILLFSTAILSSCDEDEVDAPHIVGVWSLETIADINIPRDYNWYSGEQPAEDYDINSYLLTINNDGSYVRRVEQIGTSTQAEKGTWVINEEDEELILSSDGQDDIVWTIQQNDLDLLKVYFPTQSFIISNRDRERLLTDYPTQDEINTYLESLSEAEVDALFPIISHDLLFSFKRETTTP